MKIRKAIKKDYPMLMELFNGFVSEKRYSKHDNDSFDKVIRSKRNFVYVAEDNNTLVGFITFSVRNVVRYPKPIMELDEIFVSTFSRRKGLGIKLMRVMELHAKKLDCYRIFIESHYDHKPAHAFNEKLGYTNYGYHFIKDL